MNIYLFISSAISVITECFILIYYTNAVLEYKHSRFVSNLIIILGYLLYVIVFAFEIPFLNITGFILVNFIVLYSGFSESVGSALLKTGIFTALIMISEIFASMLISVDIDEELYQTITFTQDIIFSVASKVIYFFAVSVLRILSVNRNRSYKASELFGFLLLPLSTCIFLTLFNKIHITLTDSISLAFVGYILILVLTNFVVYMVGERIIEKNAKIRELQNIEHKKQVDYASYQLIKEKYNDLKILVHDFNKYCTNIEAAIDKDSQSALALINNIKAKNRELLLVEYTDNNALNILLSQKMAQCNSMGIDFTVNIHGVKLAFVSEEDTVSIFANLLDNAIESCLKSENKKISLDIYLMNNSYLVIRIDNSSDKQPIIYKNKLVTRKKDKEMHGIGLTSVTQSLNNYKGKMRWDYDSEAKMFNTTILINYPNFATNPAD